MQVRVTQRVYRPLYHADTVNHCPACGHTHWHVGRSMAQCAFCDAALPLTTGVGAPAEPMFWTRGSQICRRAA